MIVQTLSFRVSCVKDVNLKGTLGDDSILGQI